MVMFLVLHPMVFIILSLFDLLECPVMLITLILVIRLLDLTESVSEGFESSSLTHHRPYS